MELSDEFLLAAACCRWPPSPARDEAVRAAASRPIDWQRFQRVVRRQRVEGLVSDALTRAGVPVPHEHGARLRHEAQAIARQNLRFAAEALRLHRVMDRAGVQHFFVKGVTLDALAYRTLGLKKGRDIDLVVAPQAAEQACALLEEAGYRRTHPGPEVGPDRLGAWLAHCKETGWTHAASGIVVELHTGLVENPLLLRGVGVHSPRQEVEIAAGLRLPTLAPDELFAYLCVHGATHGWSRMKWLADVSALLSSADAGELDRLYRRSQELGVGRCSAQALLLCERLFGLRLPSALQAELTADRSTRALVRIALAVMAGRKSEIELDDTVLGTLPIHLSHLLLGRGFAYKASEARRKLRSPHDRSAIALPRPLQFFYPVIALPSWLWRRVRRPGAA